MISKQQKNIFLAACAIVSATLFGMLLAKVHLNEIPDSESQVITTGVFASRLSKETLIDDWTLGIKNLGGKASYELFKDIYKDESTSEKHNLAHFFGLALYNAEGMLGLSVCDFDYSYGCFHEFIGQAIIHEGIGVIKEIDQFCKEEFNCQHGIGHGLLAYSGYDERGLSSSLDLCNTLGSVDVQDGCFGGIFMEYNVRTMLENESVREKKSNESVDAVCNLVPQYAKEACYFWLPQWIMAEGPEVLDKNADSAREACGQVSNFEYRKICYKGLGYEIRVYTDNWELAKKLCETLTKDTADAYEVHCKTGAANSFFIADLNPNQTKGICIGLQAEELNFCSYYASYSNGKRIPNFSEDWKKSSYSSS
jgi:hypothetical protein